MLMRAPESLNENFRAVKKKMDADYIAHQSLWVTHQAEASIDTRLEAGDSSLMEQYTNFPSASGRSWYFNRVRPLCSMVSGHQRKNRKSTVVLPLENGDQKTSDQWTKIILGIYKRENVYETISDAFHQGACVTGMNLLHVYIDYRNDPVSGDVKVDNLAYNTFYIDPYFRKVDLSDCEFVWRRSYISHSQAASLLPKKYYEEIMNLPGNPTGTGRDGKFQFMPEASGQMQSNKVAYDEYYYRDYRRQKLLIDEETGEMLDVTDKEHIDIDRFLLENPTAYLEEQDIPTVRLAIAVQDQVFYDGPSGLDIYPFVPVVGYYNPMMPYFYQRIQGICRSLRDPQILFNRRLLLSADAAESVVNSGWKFKENAIIDVKHLFQTGQGRIIPLKEEAAMTDVEQISPPNIPQYFFQLQDSFSKEMNLVSGINEEMMGANMDDKAAILSALRQSSGLVTLQPIFDKLDNAQNILGELIMRVVRSSYVPSKIRALLEGEEPAPLFYDKAFGKYHCMVELGLNTESQKQMQAAQLMQLTELGYKFSPKVMLNAFSIQNKEEIIEDMMQQEKQQAEMAQQQAQVQMEQIRAQTQLAQAHSVANQGLGAERFSRIQENQALAVERRAEAEKDEQLALLNFAKAIKEIESIDIAQLEKIISLQRMLKAAEEQREQSPQPFQSSFEGGR
jgi:hypothetical protein